MNRFFYIVIGLGLIALAMTTAWDSARLSALFLGAQFNVPNLGYVIAGSVILLGAVVSDQFKQQGGWRYLVLVSMLGLMGADAYTNVSAQWGQVVAAETAQTRREEATASLEFVNREVIKLEEYKPVLAQALQLATDPLATPAVKDAAIRKAQAIVSAEGYPIAVDGEWGPKTRGAVETYSPWVRDRLNHLSAQTVKHQATLDETVKALEFTLTRKEAVLYGVGMTLIGWLLSFIGGLCFAAGPTLAEREKQIEQREAEQEDALAEMEDDLREEVAYLKLVRSQA